MNHNKITSLGLWEFVLDMGSSSHWGLIIAPGQGANGDNLGVYFDHLNNKGILSILIRIAPMRRL